MTKDFVFITGNSYKAEYLSKWLGRPVTHRKIDLPEIQSLDPREVAEDKARRAYHLVEQPVLIDDVSLAITAMGRLPGTLIKWFLQEVGTAGIARMAAALDDQTATASMMYVLFDGTSFRFFEASVPGRIAPKPRGESHGWNSIFIPQGHAKTFAELDDETFHAISHRGLAVRQLCDYLASA